ADRLVQKIAAHVAAEEERKQHGQDTRNRAASDDDREKQARREQRQRDYEARVSARARNLELGAALAKWQPKLDTEAVKLLGSLVLLHYGTAAAWAHRLCVEQPTTTNKQGKVTVRYPRGAQAEKDGTLVHAGECEQEWSSAYNAADDNETDEEALDEAA